MQNSSRLPFPKPAAVLLLCMVCGCQVFFLLLRFFRTAGAQKAIPNPETAAIAIQSATVLSSPVFGLYVRVFPFSVYTYMVPRPRLPPSADAKGTAAVHGPGRVRETDQR